MINQEMYRDTFRKTLTTYGVESLSSLSEAVKVHFFDDLKSNLEESVSKSKKSKAAKKEAKGKNKNKTSGKKGEKTQSPKQKAYREFFKSMLDKYKVSSPFKLDKETKAKFFSEVKEGWAKGGKVTASTETMDDIDYDHFLSNSEDESYDYLVEAFDSDPDLNDDFESDSSASSEARKMGLKHAGKGNYVDKHGKVKKVSVHGQLLGVRAGNKVKKHVAAMKVAHHAKNKHEALALKAHAKGDHKAAARHEKTAARHEAKYEKLKNAIGGHGEHAHKKIIKHLGKAWIKRVDRNAPKRKVSHSSDESLSKEGKLSAGRKAFIKFFKGLVKVHAKKAGVEEFKDLSQPQKASLFSDVKKQWHKSKVAHASESHVDWDSLSAEKKRSHLQEAYHTHFRTKLEKYGVDSQAKLSAPDKKKFFNEVSKDWPKAKAKAIREAKKLGIEVPKQKRAVKK